jgi:hypothetical protein
LSAFGHRSFGSASPPDCPKNHLIREDSIWTVPLGLHADFPLELLFRTANAYCILYIYWVLFIFCVTFCFPLIHSVIIQLFLFKLSDSRLLSNLIVSHLIIVRLLLIILILEMCSRNFDPNNINYLRVSKHYISQGSPTFISA